MSSATSPSPPGCRPCRARRSWYSSTTLSAGTKYTSGWVAFNVSPLESPKLTLRYKRDATSVIGSEAIIAARTFDVPLVK